MTDAELKEIVKTMLKYCKKVGDLKKVKNEIDRIIEISKGYK